MRKIMSSNKNGQIYLPSDLRKVVKIFEDEKTHLVIPTDIEGIADTRTILLMPAGMSAVDALKSLEVIKKHLEHEAEVAAQEVEQAVPS